MNVQIAGCLRDADPTLRNQSDRLKRILAAELHWLHLCTPVPLEAP